MMRFAPTLLLVLFLALGASSSEDEETTNNPALSALRRLYDNLSDVKHDCVNFGGSDWENSFELIEPVDCEDKAARYDYSLKLGNGKKPKRKAALDGKVQIRFSSSGGAHEMKDGFKLSRCYRLPDGNISSISGSFASDRIRGRVVLEFHNDTLAVGHAEDNRLVGPVRWFDTKGTAMAAEKDERKKVKDGKKKIKTMQAGVKLSEVATPNGEILWRQFPGGTFSFKSATSPGRTFLTDFDKVYSCSSNDGVILSECGLVTEGTLDAEKCDTEMKDVKFTPGSTLYHRFLSSAFDPAQDDPFASCTKEVGSDFAPSETNVRNVTEAWLETVAGPEDPFWMLVDSLKEPFSEGNELDLFLPSLSMRPGFEGHTLKVVGVSGALLFSGKLVKGHLKGKVDNPEDPLWLSPIRVIVGSLGGLEVGGVTPTSADSLTVGRGGPGSTPHGDYSRPLALGRIRHGQFHGLVRMFGQVTNDPNGSCSHQTLSTNLSFLGRYENGRPSGFCWRGLLGGAWVVGKVDAEGEFTGDGGDVAYVNNDFRTAFTGKFELGIMIDGQESEVIGTRCVNGIRELKFSKGSGPVFHYDQPSNVSLGDQPLLADPLDNRYIVLKDSDTFPLAGEGAHAAVDVPAGTVFVLYSGNIITKEERELLMERQKKELEEKGITDSLHPDAIANWKYRHTIGHCGLGIDIPAELEPTDRYRATLGHKVNHKFLPTTNYIQVDSARFGIINAVRTNRFIPKGEEFFASYGYPPTTNLPWYRAEYLKFANEHPELVSSATRKILETPIGSEEVAAGMGMGEDEEKEGEKKDEEKE